MDEALMTDKAIRYWTKAKNRPRRNRSTCSFKRSIPTFYSTISSSLAMKQKLQAKMMRKWLLIVGSPLFEGYWEGDLDFCEKSKGFASGLLVSPLDTRHTQ